MPEVKDVKVDLSDLKNKIASQKKELHEKQIAMGGNGAPMKGNKKSFLNELVHSMRTGQHSEAVKVVQAVNETVENKRGVPQAVAKNLNSGKKYAPPRRYVNEEVVPHTGVKTGADDWGMGGSNVSIPNGRGAGVTGEDRFDQAFNQNNEAFDRMMMSNNPMHNNPKYQKLIENYPASQPQYVVEQPQSQQLTEQIEHMNNNLEKLVESNLKSVLTNIYTKQKVQESLVELLQSKEGLDILSRAINEIVKRNKAKVVK